MSNEIQGGSILSYRGINPVIGKDVFIAPTASVIGEVEINDEASLWFGCVLRGDEGPISVGARTNVQDGVIIHCDGGGSVSIGADVTIGHGAIIHGCTIEDKVLIGMGAVVLDGAVLESGSFIAAGAVVSPGKRVTAGTLWAGVPAKPLRDVSDAFRAAIMKGSHEYQGLARRYRTGDVQAVPISVFTKIQADSST